MDDDTFGSKLPRRSVPHHPSSWDFAAKELTNLVKDDKRVTPMLAGCPEFSWIFRKFDIYLIAVKVEGYLFELGSQRPVRSMYRKKKSLVGICNFNGVCGDPWGIAQTAQDCGNYFK
ncbi:hypothetical protein Tco_0664174 [Tanacetum coccineum]